MPFDITQTTTPLARRRRLIDALRGEMPANFEWHFPVASAVTSCGTMGCAMGLAKEIGLIEIAWFHDIERSLALTSGQVDLIFAADDIFTLETYGVTAELVTPLMVADALEQTLV